MKKTKKLFTILLAVVLLCQAFISNFCITASAASPYAESFDRTKIEDDLSGVDLKNYPENPLGEVDIISFVEYCYSNQSYLSEYYGLYVYVYNPTGKDITITNGNNTINALVGFDENGTEIYDDVNLEYLDRTSDNLIYKFKLSRSLEFLKMAREYAIDHEGKRLYKFIDLEIKHGKDTAHADISKEYVWSGFAAYCDDDSSAVSTLECTDFGTRSIHLNLTSTNYRFEAYDPDDSFIEIDVERTMQDELNSVFFTIPDEYFEDFGNLYKIKAEWYEYKTSLMYVTSDYEAYSALKDMRNKRINQFGQRIDNYGNVIDESAIGYYRVLFEADIDLLGTGKPMGYHRSYNPWPRKIDGTSVYSFEDQLDWIFYRESSVLGQTDYCVPRDEVKEYMEIYTKTFNDQELIRNKYASDLFVESIDTDRIQFLEDSSATSGYVEMEFTAGENFDPGVGNQFIDADKSQTAWNEFWFGTKYKEINYSPIVVIDVGDLYLSVEAFSEKYYVDLQDTSDIMTEARRAYSDGEVPVLLRFAVTDYYSSAARFDCVEDGSQNISDKDGYVAQETMFLDFDVLSLTFQSEDGYNEVAIGVVAVPIDIINGLTPPASLVEDEEWWQKLVALLLLIILLIVLFFLVDKIFPGLGTIFKAIFKVIGWVLSSIFDLLTWPFRAIDKNIKSSKRRAPSHSKSRKKKSKQKKER